MQLVLRKRKAKGSGQNSNLTPDLNFPAVDTSTLVPTGLVTERVHQLAKNVGEVGATASEDLPNKNKRPKSQNNARSVAIASGSPRRAQ